MLTKILKNKLIFNELDICIIKIVYFHNNNSCYEENWVKKQI